MRLMQKKKTISLIVGAVVLSSALFGSSVSFAQTNSSTSNQQESSCGVPVCDVKDFMRKYKELPQNPRYKTITDFRSQYKKSTEGAVWDNLLEVGTQIVAFFVEIEEEDWMIREAQGLVDDSLLGLFKFRRPFENSYFFDLFKRLSSENRRFEVLKTMGELAPKMNDPVALREIVTFAGLARKYCMKLEDADWVYGEAQRLQGLATARLVMLDPAHEGVFDLKTKCLSGDCSNYLPLKKMVMVETTARSGYGLVITFPLDNGGTPAYSFYQSSFNGGPEKILATSTSAGGTTPRPAEIRVVVDRETGNASGEIRDSRSTGVLGFEAVPVARVQSVAQAPAEGAIPSIEMVTGIYDVKLPMFSGKLVVRRSLEGFLYASMVGPEVSLDFKFAHYVPEKATLTLVAITNVQNMVKVVLKTHIDANGDVILKGFSYSSRNGFVLDWTGKRVEGINDEEPTE